ncbi:MAG: thiol:disulfide interchange protein DsbA/DsbL [Burkholderiales bacterium]|nr:MAG: thiol:disulfide interchange protein DsbA/DsbL [Burkholderiales bacterium]
MKRITRREFVAAVGVAGLTSGAHAQQGTGEGHEFRSVKPPAPSDAPAGKVEVIEFFWYGCPHCYALEPVIKDWLKRLPPEIAFRKVHVPWQVQAHQQLFFTLETMDRAQALDDKVFAAIHADRNKLDTPDAMADLMAKNGVDRKQFLDTYGSFGVRTRMQRATQLAAAYQIDGVPTLGVGGRFVTAPSMTGSNPGALKVVEQLVARIRKGA